MSRLERDIADDGFFGTDVSISNRTLHCVPIGPELVVIASDSANQSLIVISLTIILIR